MAVNLQKKGNKGTEKPPAHPLLLVVGKKKKRKKKLTRHQQQTGGLGYSQIGRAADGIHPGPSLMRKQVVEFLHAVTYLRGSGVFLFVFVFVVFFALTFWPTRGKKN